MTLEVPMQLAALCLVPYAAAAQRLMEVTWRTCAIVVSQNGVVRTVFPSFSFLMACAGRPGSRSACWSAACAWSLVDERRRRADRAPTRLGRGRLRHVGFLAAGRVGLNVWFGAPNTL
jgi:hypothetical protein